MKQPRFSPTWNVVAGALLLAWAAWWGWNLYADRVAAPVKLGYLVIPQQPLGGDFSFHDRAARHFFRGENPWDPWPDFGGYTHTPAALPFFLWTPLFSPRAATVLWILAVVAILAAGTALACRYRAFLSLEPVPVLPALALVLWSNPVLFEIDRGQVDVLVLVLVWAGWRSLRRGTVAADLLASLLFGTAIWVKLYPFLMLFGIAALRRTRVLVATVAVLVLIGVGAWKWNLDCAAANSRIKMRANQIEGIWLLLQGRLAELQPDVTTWKHEFRAHEHSLSGYAQGLLSDLGLPNLAKVPGILYAGAVLVPLALGLSWLQFRYRTAGTELPLLVLLALAGTFVMPLAWDYGLCLLPLVLLAVWSRHDPWPAQLCAGAFLFYLFPIRPELRAQSHIFFQLKLLGLLGTAWMLARRIRAPQPVLHAVPSRPQVVAVR